MPFSGVNLFLPVHCGAGIHHSEQGCGQRGCELLTHDLFVQMSPQPWVSPSWRAMLLSPHLGSAGWKQGTYLPWKSTQGRSLLLPVTPKKHHSWRSLLGPEDSSFLVRPREVTKDRILLIIYPIIQSLH